MPNYRPLPSLERLNELLEIVDIPEDKYGVWSGLIWKVAQGNRIAGSVAGTLQRNRKASRLDWRVGVDGVTYLASRIIYYMTRVEDPGNIQVDHEDQNWLNNNGYNLRLDVNGNIQSVNQPMRRNNTSGVSGVSWHNRDERWQAQVRIKGKADHLGYFTCKIEAASVVNEKWIELEWHKLGRKLNDLEAIECDCEKCKTS